MVAAEEMEAREEMEAMAETGVRAAEVEMVLVAHPAPLMACSPLEARVVLVAEEATVVMAAPAVTVAQAATEALLILRLHAISAEASITLKMAVPAAVVVKAVFRELVDLLVRQVTAVAATMALTVSPLGTRAQVAGPEVQAMMAAAEIPDKPAGTEAVVV
jgi:hypothetical protein